jgi:hypothetical protein
LADAESFLVFTGTVCAKTRDAAASSLDRVVKRFSLIIDAKKSLFVHLSARCIEREGEKYKEAERQTKRERERKRKNKEGVKE